MRVPRAQRHCTPLNPLHALPWTSKCKEDTRWLIKSLDAISLKRLGVTIGAAAASAGSIVTPKAAEAQQKLTPKGNIPSTPFKTGHMTFFTGPAAVLGEQSYKGHILAAEEINAQGGLLGKRQIETLKADEAAGADTNVKELRRLKLSEKIDLFTGVISSGNTPPSARSPKR